MAGAKRGENRITVTADPRETATVITVTGETGMGTAGPKGTIAGMTGPRETVGTARRGIVTVITVFPGIGITTGVHRARAQAKAAAQGRGTVLSRKSIK